MLYFSTYIAPSFLASASDSESRRGGSDSNGKDRDFSSRSFRARSNFSPRCPLFLRLESPTRMRALEERWRRVDGDVAGMLGWVEMKIG